MVFAKVLKPETFLVILGVHCHGVQLFWLIYWRRYSACHLNLLIASFAQDFLFPFLPQENLEFKRNNDEMESSSSITSQ